jgi:hypothetical protein
MILFPPFPSTISPDETFSPPLEPPAFFPSQSFFGNSSNSRYIGPRAGREKERKVLTYLFPVKECPWSGLNIKKYFLMFLMCDQLLSQIVFLLLLPSQWEVSGKIFI